MSFTLVKGEFAPQLGRPDGDSVRFIPKNVSLLEGLKGRPVRVYTNDQGIKSVQLRYEGIDTLEKAAIVPYSSDATTENMRAIGGSGQTNQPNTPGYILTRRTGPNSRPICFVYKGDPGMKDGSIVFVNKAWVKKSVNYHQIVTGHAYPMFYNTLFADLREVLVQGVVAARAAGLGIWPVDKTMKGITYTGPASLKTVLPIYPKLWRRLKNYGKPTLSGFLQYVKDTEEPVVTMSDNRDLQFEDVIKVTGNKVKLTYPPEDLKFRSKGT